MKITSNSNHKDFSRFKEVLQLTFPQLGLMFCHLAISMADIWSAGKIHSNLQASLGIMTQINTMLIILTSVIASGCMAAISQSLGAGLKKRAKFFAGLIVILAGFSGSVTALSAFFLEERIYLLLKISPEILPSIRIFYISTILSLPFSYLLIMINSIFRAYKKVWLPFFTLLLMAVMNFIGNLGFGLGYFGFPKFGIYGIAWTTFFCAVFGLACNIFLAGRYRILEKTSFAPWKWNKKAMPYLFKIGMPSALAQVITQTGSLTLLAIVGLIPQKSIAILAGMSIALRIHSVLLFPLGAINMSVVILSGYMLGADKKSELIRFSSKTAGTAAVLTIFPSFLLWLLRDPIAAFFTDNAEVQNQAKLFLTFICLSTPFSAAAGILNSVFSGTGATILTAKINIAVCWLISIPLSYCLAILLDLGAYGIYCSDLTVKLLHFIFILILFRQKKWLQCGLKRRK